MKTNILLILAVLLVGCGGRTNKTTAETATTLFAESEITESVVEQPTPVDTLALVESVDREATETPEPAEVPVEQTQTIEIAAPICDTNYFHITYNRNRPINGFRISGEGVQYFVSQGIDNISTYLKLTFTSVKTENSFTDMGRFFRVDSLIPAHLSLSYHEKTYADYDDLFWFVDLDFDGQKELLTGVAEDAGRGGSFMEIFRIVNGELINAKQEFIAKNRLFDGYVERDRFSVDSLRREITYAGGTWAHWEHVIYTYEDDGTYRWDRSIGCDYDGSIREISIISPQKDTLRRYKFTHAEYEYRLENVEGFIENL